MSNSLPLSVTLLQLADPTNCCSLPVMLGCGLCLSSCQLPYRTSLPLSPLHSLETSHNGLVGLLCGGPRNTRSPCSNVSLQGSNHITLCAFVKNPPWHFAYLASLLYHYLSHLTDPAKKGGLALCDLPSGTCNISGSFSSMTYAIFLRSCNITR